METLSPRIRELYDKVKLKLLLGHPFFASLLFKLKHVWDEECDTAWTDGVSIGFNPTFFEGLAKEEAMGVMAHEVLHVCFLHHTRRGNRNPEDWNRACDYAANLILRDSGFVLPGNALYDTKYRGMSAETIYELIKGKPDNNGSGPGPGEVRDFPGIGDDEQTSNEEYKQTTSMIQANELAKLAGKGSSAIDQLIKELVTPKVNWQDELKRHVTEKIQDDYTWKKPNKRYLSTGFYLPVRENETFGLIGVFWDSSASTREYTDEFASNLNELKRTVQAPLHLVYCDYKVTRDQFFDIDEDMVIEPKGGGGTRFTPPFEWCEENDIEPKLVIYFTDGECYDFPPEPEYEVIWLVCGNSSFNPPFGTTIRVQ